MEHWKNTVAVLAVVAISGAGLTLNGCGGDSDGGTTSTTGKSSSIQETVAASPSFGSMPPTDVSGTPVPPSGMGASLFDELVAEGIVTQEQADQIISLMSERERGQGPGIQGSLDDAVESGIITQEQADAITEFMESRIPNGVPGTPPSDQGMGMAPFGFLVSEGVITQEQADQIEELSLESGGQITDVIDQAVAEGIITEEQAEQVRDFMSGMGMPGGQGEPEFQGTAS